MNFLEEHISCPIINVHISYRAEQTWHAWIVSVTGKLANLQGFHKSSTPKQLCIDLIKQEPNSMSSCMSCGLTGKLKSHLIINLCEVMRSAVISNTQLRLIRRKF
ncbi:hypothetical protein AMECASPLE_024049 [Ameca splendens]|uniref:Uncharacterized protein n=1 Tax=Ameca splendens TaxID=208324 RepID=A0ABV0YGE4_9TELE